MTVFDEGTEHIKRVVTEAPQRPFVRLLIFLFWVKRKLNL